MYGGLDEDYFTYTQQACASRPNCLHICVLPAVAKKRQREKLGFKGVYGPNTPDKLDIQPILIISFIDRGRFMEIQNGT